MTSQSQTPEEVTATLQAIWRTRGEMVQEPFEITACPYTAFELSELHQAGRRLGYLPAECATQATRHKLGVIFPAMKSYGLFTENPVTNDHNPSGWFDYEAQIDAPHTSTTEAELVGALSQSGHSLLSLNQYIVASQDTKLATGRYLDEQRTWARVGSRLDGKVVAVRFDGEQMAGGQLDEQPVPGSLLVAYDLAAEDCGPIVGGRSSTTAASLRGLVSEPAREVTDPRHYTLEGPRGDLDAEWSRLSSSFVRCGYHHELGMAEQDYLATLPRLGLQPPQYRGRFDVPLVVETRIPWERQAALAGVGIGGNSATTPVYRPVHEPATAYAGWFNAWGQRFPDPVAPADARVQLASDEVGATVHALIAMELAHPTLNRSARFFEAIGHVLEQAAMPGLSSFSRFERTACVYWWRGRPEIGANLHPTAFSIFRPLARGRTINIL